MKKLNSIFIFITMVVVFTTISNAQYKLNIENFWVYSDDNQEWKISIIDTSVLFDSILYYETYEQKEWLPKSNYSVQNNGDTNQYFIRQREDDLFEKLVIYNAIHDTVIHPYLYKNNAQLGDKWIYRISYDNDSTVVDTSWSEVLDVFQGYQFGEWRTIKKIHYYSNNPQVPLDYYKYFCDDFGELSEEGYDYRSELKGCYIDGIAYGDTMFATVDIHNFENKISNFYLIQNYPNPFNPNTIIKYSIPENGNVRIEVFDMLGKKIITLLNEYKTNGNYKVIFEPTALGVNLKSGIYFYRLISNNFIQTKKMIYLK